MATVTRLSSLQEIVSLKPDWDRLLENAPNKSVFMTCEWLITWLEIFGRNYDLWWLIVKDGSENIVGGAPLYLRKEQNGLLLPHRELRFVGTGAAVSPEHLDILVDSRYGDEAIQAISEYLMNQASDWDVLLLTDLSHPKAQVYRLESELWNRGAVPAIEEQFPSAPYIPLPASYEEYFKSLGPRMRAHIARYRKRGERELGFRFHVWSQHDGNLDGAFDEFERLFRERKQSIGIANKFESVEGYREFHHRLARRFAERDWLYLAFLRNGEEAVAAQYTFRYRDTLYSYHSGFDPAFSKHNVFKILRSYVAEDAIHEGIKEFDLLRGEEPYKKDWNAIPRKKHSLRCFSPSFYGRTLKTVLDLRRIGKRIFEKAIGNRQKIEPKRQKVDQH